jgi:NAD(P)-dependent dehydrogenase (short-subunit alcohol dehydrogenase family)
VAEPKPHLGKIALVTGASRGIGQAIALTLAKAGAQVVAVARTQGGLEDLDDEIGRAGGDKATLVPMDITEGDGLDHLGLALHQRFGHVDILVHAAATLGPLTPVGHLDPKHWDRVVAANLTASYRLIRSIEPLLRAASPAGKAVFLTTAVAARPRAFWGAYAATKAGMEALVRCWADEIEDTGVRAMLVNPGKMRTRMRAEAYPGELPETNPDPAEIGPFILDLLEGDRGLPTETVSFPMWQEHRNAK